MLTIVVMAITMETDLNWAYILSHLLHAIEEGVRHRAQRSRQILHQYRQIGL